jgi:hypothetical protein
MALIHTKKDNITVRYLLGLVPDVRIRIRKTGNIPVYCKYFDLLIIIRYRYRYEANQIHRKKKYRYGLTTKVLNSTGTGNKKKVPL